ncbi:hypothetical protein E2C01_028807 [Portunus trituberculatus]|uniref:Uncharacterized protein n=1 Tax=Portunus trituberculatus TaxID=210409 RepID=A0A5B7EQ81_PORTR|nr:hypothetical protein [Portunus trituberculatus]
MGRDGVRGEVWEGCRVTGLERRGVDAGWLIAPGREAARRRKRRKWWERKRERGKRKQIHDAKTPRAF